MAHYNLGVAHQHISKDYARAIDSYDKAIRILPNLKNAYLNKGYIYFETGRYDMAFVEFEKSLEIDSNFSEAKRMLTEARKRLNLVNTKWEAVEDVKSFYGYNFKT